jgi:hypothetical protein
MKYEYDKVYSYEKILEEVKELILPTIIDRINPEDIVKTGLIKQDLANIIYTQIMALGYNNEDINASLNDLMPRKNPIVYPGTNEIEQANMAMHLCAICEDYSHQVRAFKNFHQMTKELKPRNEVIRAVKLHILLA